MWSLFTNNKKILSFSFSIYFFTVLGQSYFLSFFNSPIQDFIGISGQKLSLIYSLATLISSLFLPFMGRFIDSLSIKKITIMASIGLTLGYISLALAASVWALFIAYFLIRLMGQITLGLIPSTTLSRYFTQTRGRALSIMTMGKYLGDGILPSLAVLALTSWGHRGALIFLGLCFFCVTMFLTFKLVSDFESTNKIPENNQLFPGADERLIKLLKDWKIVFTITAGVILPFTMTGVFFQQSDFLFYKGWSKEIFASAFIIYSLSQLVMSVLSGFLIDKISATVLMPFSLITLGIGLCFYQYLGMTFGPYLFLGAVGVAAAISSMGRMAFYAEHYPGQLLGRIRSIDSVFMVMGTSLAPVLFAFLIGKGLSINTLINYLQLLNMMGVILYLLVALGFKKNASNS